MSVWTLVCGLRRLHDAARGRGGGKEREFARANLSLRPFRYFCDGGQKHAASAKPERSSIRGRRAAGSLQSLCAHRPLDGRTTRSPHRNHARDGREHPQPLTQHLPSPHRPVKPHRGCAGERGGSGQTTNSRRPPSRITVTALPIGQRPSTRPNSAHAHRPRRGPSPPVRPDRHR